MWKQTHRCFICMSYWSRVEDLVFPNNIRSVVFILQKAVLKYRESSIMKVRCWYLQRAMIQSFLRKKIQPSCFWEASHWVKGSSGGILFLPARNASNRQRGTGSRGGLYCHPLTTMNLFRCRKISRGHPKRRDPNRFHELLIKKRPSLFCFYWGIRSTRISFSTLS